MPRKRKRAALKNTVEQMPQLWQACDNAKLQCETPQAMGTGCEWNSVWHATPGDLLSRYMERQMALGGQMNSLYGINFYGGNNNTKLASGQQTMDVEGEMIQLRTLLQPKQQQQLLLNDHVQRLLELNDATHLAHVLEESFLCGLLDVAQLQQLQKLLALQHLSPERRRPLTNFYRRLSAELPHFRYDMCHVPQHVQYLQRYLMLHELNPNPQGRRLLNASMEYMTQLQLPELQHFLDALNPAQLQQLVLHLCCSYIQLPWRQQQRLHQTTLRVLCGKLRLQLPPCNARRLRQLLSTPVDEPMTMQQRHFLQHLLDHLLPMPKAEQLSFLQDLDLSISKVRRFRLILHHPALLCVPLQLKQLYSNLKRLTR
ncbi:hypothetical protein ACLKA7_001621 [Drosophila subpalustris]